MYKSKENGKFMTASELADYLDVTRNMAYTLLHREDFPSIQIGSSLFAVRDEVDEWVRRQAVKGGYDYGTQER